MGLLDWLSDSLGGLASNAGANPIGLSEPMTSAMMPPGAPPIPMPQPRPDIPQQGMATPPQMFDPAPALPPMPPMAPMPPTAAPDPAALLPNATPTSAPPLPHPIEVRGAPPPMLMPPGGGGAMPQLPPQADGLRPEVSGPHGGLTGSTSFLGRALGLDPNADMSLRGALGAGFSAAGNSAGKSPFQAFSSGLGSGMEGGVKTEQKGYDQRLHALQLAVRAQAAGDTAAYHENMAVYAGERLKLETDKIARGGGKSGAWNKPDSQRFIDAQNALSKDPEVRASQKMLEGLQKTVEPTSPEMQEAIAKHKALIVQKEKEYLAGVGLDKNQVMDLAKNPPGSKQHPHVVTSQADFDTYVKPGQFYKNPADGKVYIRKGAEPATNSGEKGDSSAIPAVPTAPASTLPEPPLPADPASRPSVYDPDEF